MIFLSHNRLDKPLVEPFALGLSKVFGKDNVFYDSWSIKPGDGIVDRMNAGLGDARLFLFFISANSLESEMVKLEWQNALMKASSGQLRLVPVRLDASLIPPILLQTLYLDLFTNGLESTLRQVIDIAEGKNTFSPQFQGFSNLKSTIEEIENGWLITVMASHFTEPRCRFYVLSDETETTASISIVGTGMYEGAYHPSLNLGNGARCNAFLVGHPSSLAPNFPLRIKFSAKNGVSRPSLHGILHQKSETRWESGVPPVSWTVKGLRTPVSFGRSFHS